MSIYKVHVKRIELTTTYITNSTELARIEATPDHYNVKQEGKTIATAATYEEAEEEAKKAVTHLMASVGVTPNFINE
jgi:hypothetical protein